MRQTPYSFLTDHEFLTLMENRASTDLEVEAAQRLRIAAEHTDEDEPLCKELRRAS